MRLRACSRIGRICSNRSRLTAHVTWIVLLAHSWSLHGLNKIANRFLHIPDPEYQIPAVQGFGPCPSLSSQCSTRRVTKR
ncbi:hypothetical protein FDU21_19900 [Xanthomonas oryzae pv. oryzae]|nr:hypothetical protein FDU21_19900 [Xanthomonas oryzae pv. oryzae]